MTTCKQCGTDLEIYAHTTRWDGESDHYCISCAQAIIDFWNKTCGGKAVYDEAGEVVVLLAELVRFRQMMEGQRTGAR